MGKKNCISTGRVLYQSDPDFDWSVYDNGYRGGSSLCVNPNVKTRNPKDKVFCHEAYAQELYDMIEDHFSGRTIEAKDMLKGAVYNITGVNKVSDHEISIESNDGMSTTIDLNKEHGFLNFLGCKSTKLFTDAVEKSVEFKDSLIKSGLVAKVTATGRISLWEGTKARLESEFMETVRTGDTSKAYRGKVTEVVNNGGFFVDVLGIKCFMPGSQASNTVINNFEDLVGKTLNVIPVNFTQGAFVVSHKKYLDSIIPTLIEEQLSVGQEVSCRITGFSKNGIFVAIKDNNDEWMFSGLCHRAYMSKEFEKEFNRGYYRNGDQLHLLIQAINKVDNGYRIVLGDKPVVVESKEEED